MMMLEKNSDEIIKLIDGWIQKNVPKPAVQQTGYASLNPLQRLGGEPWCACSEAVAAAEPSYIIGAIAEG